MFDVKSPFGDFMFRLGKLQMCQEDFVSLEDFADYAAAAVYNKDSSTGCVKKIEFSVSKNNADCAGFV